jgi:hypothetical protein
MRFYHVSAAGLIVGQTLLPGRWGEQARQFGRKRRALSDLNDAKTLVWETTLEAARRATAPSSVSRLECVFACSTESDAVKFRDRFRPGAAIYAVETMADCATHFGDYDLITNGTDEPFIDYWVNRALRYWVEHPTGICEVLVGGAVQVVGR